MARIKIIILDACHSGTVKGVKNSGIMSKEFYDTIYPVPEGFVILTSCKLYEYSYEYEQMKKSVFSYINEGTLFSLQQNLKNLCYYLYR